MKRHWPYLKAGRAEQIPAGASGLWYVKEINNPFRITLPNGKERAAGKYTMLLRWTDATIHLGHGECVMIDDLPEMQTHLQAALTARGRVLVTGLGLACVARMLQQNPAVESITILEKSADVIKLVWPHTPHERIELIEADAFAYLKATNRKWDCGWHDIWTDRSAGEPALAVEHQRLLGICADRVSQQGAWAFPRRHRRAFANMLATHGPRAVRECFE